MSGWGPGVHGPSWSAGFLHAFSEVAYMSLNLGLNIIFPRIFLRH